MGGPEERADREGACDEALCLAKLVILSAVCGEVFVMIVQVNDSAEQIPGCSEEVGNRKKHDDSPCNRPHVPPHDKRENNEGATQH